MTKKEIIETIAATAKTSKAAAGRAFEAVIDGMKDTVGKGGKVSIQGFCTIQRKSRKATQARNPKTGESISVPARNVPYFKASTEFIKHVNA